MAGRVALVTALCAALSVTVCGMAAVTSAASVPAKESPIKHVVMVMLENRSFDHYLGFLRPADTSFRGLKGDESNPVDPRVPGSPRCAVKAHGSAVDTPDAGHSHVSTTRQQFGGLEPGHVPAGAVPTMDGFVLDGASHDKSWGCSVMESQNPANISVMAALVDEFVTVDACYSSHPGPTEVNRMFVHSGTSHGWDENPTDEEYIAGFPQPTIFDKLSEQGHEWKVYMEDDVTTTWFFRSMRHPKYLGNYHSYFRFRDDARRGRLPAYSLVEPRFFSVPGLPASDQHPPGHTIYQGEKLIKDIYDHLRASPQWNETALIVTFDEHGGLYDHVPSPARGVPNPDGINSTTFDFTRLGVRVPTLIVSPWVRRGHVEHEPAGPHPDSQYDHTSVLSTLKHVFNLPGFLTKRDEWAGSYHGLFETLDAPRTDTPATLPEPAAPSDAQRERLANEHMQPLSCLQRGILQGYAAMTGDASGKVTHLENEGDGAAYVAERLAHWRKNRV